jgi:2'-5' RNA ligase
MAAEVCSVWLIPEAGWQRELTALVDDLARRFSTPRFAPHLTIIGGQTFDRAELSRRLALLVPGTAPVVAPIRDVVTGDAFFRSFYALFDAGGALLDLKRRVDRAVLRAETSGFMPHVSLLYGAVAAGPKAAAAADLCSRLAGRPVRFDRLEVVRSGEEVPIAEWRTLESFVLDG